MNVASPQPAALSDIALIVDLGRYPISAPDGADASRLVHDCRAALLEHGVATLPGFVRPDAVAAMAAESEASLDRAFYCDNRHNAYLKAPDASLPTDHPRNRMLATQVGSIAYDLMAPGATLRRLYAWDPLVAFIGRVLGREPFFRLADPLGACSVNVFQPGMGHQWHFDESEFTTTLMLQPAEQGGHFDYAPLLRPEQGEDHNAVGRILDGDESAVRRLAFEPGTLSLFNGRRSLHRVTPCGGGRTRLVAVLCFASEPGTMNSEAVRKLFWGRAA